MSTTVRKARKRFRRNAKYPEVNRRVAVDRGVEHFDNTGRFHHPVKTGTPVPNREENQPFIHTHGSSGKIVNSASAAAKRRIAEYKARTHASTRGLPWPDHRRASRAA